MRVKMGNHPERIGIIIKNPYSRQKPERGNGIGQGPPPYNANKAEDGGAFMERERQEYVSQLIGREKLRLAGVRDDYYRNLRIPIFYYSEH